jgi:hypothetical protein
MDETISGDSMTPLEFGRAAVHGLNFERTANQIIRTASFSPLLSTKLVTGSVFFAPHTSQGGYIAVTSSSTLLHQLSRPRAALVTLE